MPKARQLTTIDTLLAFFCPTAMVAYATEARCRVWTALILSFIPTSLFVTCLLADRLEWLKKIRHDFTLDGIIGLQHMTDTIWQTDKPLLGRLQAMFTYGFESTKTYFTNLYSTNLVVFVWMAVVLLVQFLFYLQLVALAIYNIHKTSKSRKAAEFKALAHGLDTPPLYPARQFYCSDLLLMVLYPPVAIALHCSWRSLLVLSTITSFWSQWWLIKNVVQWKSEGLWRDLIVYGSNVIVAMIVTVIDHAYSTDDDCDGDTESVSSYHEF